MEAARKRGRMEVANGGSAGPEWLTETDSFQPGIGSKSKPCTKFFRFWSHFAPFPVAAPIVGFAPYTSPIDGFFANFVVSFGGQQVSNFGKRLRSKTRSPATVQKSLNLTVPVLQEEIVPLSGNSFFTFVISKSHITSYRMVIPHHFCQLLPDCNVPATLYCGNRTWEVKYCGSDEPKRFSTGWKSFVNDTKISLGDGCVFELMDKEKLHLRVQILRAQLPVLAAEGGDTSDSPIVID